ncbi:ERCC4 domain-containing protein [Xylariaceae sp. FL0255]|nr:ERCC4 domain-containing protein [Xylariaceae sp. FL0255]
MPEVISLLSSSPEPRTASSFSKQRDTNAPKRSLNYRAENLARPPLATVSRISTDPLTNAKRRSSDRPNHDDGFLYLSDDFDTTGDLGPSHHKKQRTSPTLLKRTTNALSPQKIVPREVLHAAASKRWNSFADDIELSSSPADSAPRRKPKATNDRLLSDPFASPPKASEKIKSTITKAKEVLNDPFASSPRDGQTTRATGSTWSWPEEIANKLPERPEKGKQPVKQRASKSAFIHLSSDPFDEPTQHVSKPQGPKARQKAGWDPISSSAPEPLPAQDLDSSPIFPPRTRAPITDAGIPDDSESEEFPDLENMNFEKVRSLKRSQSLSNGAISRTSSHSSKKSTKAVVKSAEEKERDTNERAKAREAEKERKRIEKERAKEDRALQKEKDKALAEVNKIRTDKKVSTPEMIVDIPESINSALKVQVEALLKDLDVENTIWSSSVENVVKWRRKVTSRYNEEMALWEPIPLRIQDEGHVLVIMQADEFVKLVLTEEGHDLEAHVLKMKTHFPNAKLIYLFEGVTAWMRKNKNLLNRQYVSAVRNLTANDEAGSSSSQSRRRNNNQRQQYVDEDKIEDALLSLQVTHGMLVHHTSVPVKTAQWVAVFTQHISTVPYRKVRDNVNDAGFCMESGQVRTGDGPRDTYIHMLQEITRVTLPIAYGIANKYQTLPALVRGFEEEGPLALENCRKGANQDGALSDRVIGPSVSKRLHKIFLGRDPTSTEI